MKRFYIREVERAFGFDSARNKTSLDVYATYEDLRRRMEQGYKKGWLNTELYAKSLTKLQDMTAYLMHVIRNDSYDSELEKAVNNRAEKQTKKRKKDLAEQAAINAASNGSMKDFSEWLEYLNNIDNNKL